MEFPSIQISGRKIGPGEIPLIIAEIGINHGGSLDVAKQMVDSAARAGLEIIKHQTHVIDDEMSSLAKTVIPNNADVSIYEVMERCALNENDERELKRYVESKDMVFLSTPFSRAGADRLESMGVSAYKIGSGEMNNFPLIKHIAHFKKPMIISTGMNPLSEVYKVDEILNALGVPHAFLHTTNLYPTPPNLVRLGAMTEMILAFPERVIGLSDHTLNNNSSLAAIALGASIIERHFTDTKHRNGPDIICSMDELEAKDLIKASKEIFLMRGGTKEAAKEEQATIDFAFATCVTIKPIQKGETFNDANLWVKRPGIRGIRAEFYEDILGKKAKCNINSDTHIEWEMIDD